MAWSKEYYQKHREVIIARARKWQLENPIKYKEAIAKSWEENGEHHKEKQKEWKKKNREGWNKYQREYSQRKRDEKKKLKEDEKMSILQDGSEGEKTSS